MGNDATFVNLSDVKARKVEWLWEPLIPIGMITILEGDPGLGKSFLSMHLASVVSKGRRLPDRCKLAKGNVLYISAEDDASYTTRPRIDAMGGDPSRIRVLNDWIEFNDGGLSILEAEIEEFGPDLIIIDPLVSFVPTEARGKDPAAIRGLLHRLTNMVADNDCAIVIVRHLTKMKQENALYQGGGTIDVIATARSALRLAADPDDPEKKVLAHLKHNIGPRGPSWVFSLVPSKRAGDIPVVKFSGRSDLTVDDLQGASGGAGPKPREAADDFLKRYLGDGSRKANDSYEAAKREGISKRTLDRAKQRLGVRSRQKTKTWYWSLDQG
ncbi:AAA family ATPase [Gymnodinialimonas ceratoperidinii]|uniref:AAA family ATPase n=1 Tax=Gymnodinialimonas ceratoperidinii TaxID=2856823 RepID=A0A8F6YAC1_9RHOB|nr:AAA family ATPase [Gymnodinialimonas ceratoperidinii]QXT39428.1 AAA family ATPase [Gymnodinialimonas ceratoperidinii]